MIILVILFGAVAILQVEPGHGNISNFFDAIWWSLVTITTVGYGDLYPETFWGRIIGIVFIFMGFIIFSTFTAFIASNFIDKKTKEFKKEIFKLAIFYALMIISILIIAIHLAKKENILFEKIANEYEKEINEKNKNQCR